MNDDIKGKLSIRTGNDGVYVEASNGVPASLMIQVIDTYVTSRRQEIQEKALMLQQQVAQHKENSRRARLKDFLESAFVLSILIISFGYIAQLSGCGQQNSYNQQQYNQWGTGQ